MKNKVIAIYDLNDFNRQNIETLLFSNILEKKYDSLNIVDLNGENDNHFLRKLKWKEKQEILMANIFDRSLYHFISDDCSDLEKPYNLVKSLKNKSEITLINVCYSQEPINTEFYQLADDIVIFANLNNHIINDMIQFFIMHKIENPKVWLFVINKDSNIQNDKAFIGLRKELSKSNVKLESLNEVPNFKTLDQIHNVDPWLEIYKKINNFF